MLNISPNGIRYGVISLNSLNPDLVHELCSGPQANDLTYMAAYNDAHNEAVRHFTSAEEEAAIAAAETDNHMSDMEREDFIFEHLEASLGTADEGEYIDNCLEQFSDCFQCDEPVIEGEYEGVEYRIDYLGGAPILWVLNGPIGWAESLCSPCVPGAADLGSGFDTGETADGTTVHTCYVVPREWLAEVMA
jgi:hypothetical protein